MAQFTINEQFNGVEISFRDKPGSDIRDMLKAAGFRWHNAKKIWYAKRTPEREELAQSITAGINTGTMITPPEAKPEKRNKYGVKVGDLFHMSWGYEQTNNSWFQVVALAGAESVRVREVSPEVIEDHATGPMSMEYTVKNTGDMLPAIEQRRSIFIKNQEKGDIKRIRDFTNPVSIKIGNAGHMAHLVTEEAHSVYESWYA